MSAQGFRVERTEEAGVAVVHVSGRVGLEDVAPFRDSLRREIARPAAQYRFDLAGLESIDPGAAALLVELRGEAAERSAAAAIAGGAGGVGALVELFARRRKAPAKPPPVRIGALDQVGRATARAAGQFQAILDFLGEVIVATTCALRAPRSVNWADLGPITERSGADAWAIVSLISFLVGLILAFQAAVQLRQFGAEIFVADAVGISLTRELGPLMVAIIVAGRSGAAFAAELGTMSVSEEVDALRTIGLDPYRFLVFPRLMALVIAVPILTLLGDFVGLLGGFFVGVFGLGIPATSYILETKSHLGLWDVESGLLKSIAFGAAIALIGCERGLRTTGGATGVGRSTTASVVTILFHLVVIDFAFTLFYQVYNL
jgi:phospholipid/cholesterol/gamma-HCH transport system permease protein